MGQLRIGWIKGEGNEALKTAGRILLLAEFHKVIHAIFNRLDMPVEHGCVGLQSRRVYFPLELEPAFSVTFMSTDHRSRRLAKDLRAASRTRVKSRLNQLLNDFFV